MREDGYEPILKKSRWCLLKRKENLTEKQEAKLKDLLQYNLKIGLWTNCCVNYKQSIPFIN